MNILFTILSIDTQIDGQNFYVDAANRLAAEILDQTSHDIYISTNKPENFDIVSSRCLVRNNINQNSIFSYGREFNFNLKYHAFFDIPAKYDYLIYIDCDIKLSSWTVNSDKFIAETMSGYELAADRTNCTLKSQIAEYKNTGQALFRHKIEAYDILQLHTDEDDIHNSVLPSEHCLVFKNIPDKITKFAYKWQHLNNILQNKNGGGGAWGDGFEIGISARYAGLNNIFPLSPFYWKDTLGFQFNGNKY